MIKIEQIKAKFIPIWNSLIWGGAEQVGGCHNKGATMQKYKNQIIQKNQRCKKYKNTNI